MPNDDEGDSAGNEEGGAVLRKQKWKYEQRHPEGRLCRGSSDDDGMPVIEPAQPITDAN